ncbi:hypothetical protein X813_gp12 [Lactobacillus phage LL-Ku]|uniref:Uncharacterized protein n=1 Tax=Lactobacillus phage LL-Ku TaxID=2892343 RepID=F7V9B1_9CAUD|nr:hypothetical protein X813_gp12 [Lactobacillus phage LL-Ku]AAV30172.1 hypothetical protein [Lactobacillus phage LL-Ku]
MNSELEKIFKNFTVGGKQIPVSFLRYDGKETTYITYQEIMVDEVFSADDEIVSYSDCYDFDIYSKGNYFPIVEAVKEILKPTMGLQSAKQLRRSYEDETGYIIRRKFIHIR